MSAITATASAKKPSIKPPSDRPGVRALPRQIFGRFRDRFLNLPRLLSVISGDKSSRQRSSISAWLRPSDGRRLTSFEIDAERPALDRHAAGPHLVERTQHPPLPPQRLVC